MPVVSVNGIQVAEEPLLLGWGQLGQSIRYTDKAGLYDYHGRQLWIAKKNVRIWSGKHYAKTFAIQSAKEYEAGKSA